MRNHIIGIAGELNSGKDTVASMINYMFHVGVTKATYREWLIKRVSYEHTLSHRIIHFADSLKDCLSIIYNIPREYFDNREYKDNYWYCLNERRFVEEKCVYFTEYMAITINDLKENSLKYIIKHSRCKLLIKLRTLMQYFGTEVCRNNLSDSIWIDSTIGKAATIAETNVLCLIPDVRFDNECAAITQHPLYGGVINVKRENSNKIIHDSETIDFHCPIVIENNGTLTQLFYKVLQFVQSIK